MLLENGRPGDVSVLIVLFHSDPSLLRRCVQSIEVAAGRACVQAHLVFVDNGGGLPDLGSRNLPMTLLGEGENIGFGRAVNGALRNVQTSEVLLLNPDAALGDDALLAFRAGLHAAADSILTGTLMTSGHVDQDATIDWDFSVGRVVKRWRFRCRRSASVAGTAAGVESEKLTGAALYAATNVLRELGPFDEQFFLYGEDADLSRRARRAGHPLRRLPEARVQHDKSASASRFGAMVEFARADAAIRLAAVHRARCVSLVQRAELTVVTVLGVVLERDRSRRSARLARLRAVRRWGVRQRAAALVADDFDGPSHSA